MSAFDAVDGSSTGTRVPWMWGLLELPRFGGAIDANGYDDRPVDRVRFSEANRKHLLVLSPPLLNPQQTTEVEAHPALPERQDCTSMACYRSLYAPRAGGAYDSHHRTAGVAGCTRRRGGRVAARGARAAGRTR